MKLTVLGAGSASPQLNRHPSAFLLAVENEYILIDCGEGTQYRLMEQKIKLTRLRTICISHLHGDHYFGLAGLLSSMSLNRRTEPLTLIGPEGLKEVLDLQFRYSETELTYPLTFVVTQNQTIQLVHDRPIFKIESFPLIHRVKTTGFKVTRKKGLRHLLPELLPANFPATFIRMLKEGRDVVDPLTEKTYRSVDYTTSGEDDLVFAYCSDTAYFEKLIPFLKAVNLLYHEATFTEELADRALKTNHSTAADAAKIALKAEAKQLLIGHFSSRYKEYDGHLAEAAAIFDNTLLAEEGQSYVIV